jgi:hypothetical protein
MLIGNLTGDNTEADQSRGGVAAARRLGASPGVAPSGILSTNDHYLDGERMKMSSRFVKGAWRYE